MVDIRVGQTTVPNVVGLDQTSAEAEIAAADLEVAYAESQYSASVAAGNVISQDPAASTDVEPLTTVTLVVSLGVQVRFTPSIAPRRMRRTPYL